MRRFLTTLGVALVASALVLNGSPAKAGTLSWDDPVGDPATLAQSTLDITKVSLNFDGTTFFVALDIAQLGEPAPFGTGQFFAVAFDYGDGHYTLRVTQDRVTGDAFSFQEEVGEAQVGPIACKTCKFKLDFEASKVLIQVGFESLKSAMRKLAPGESFEALTAWSGGSYSEPSGTFGTFLWGGSEPGDSAPAPDPATFTF